MARRKSFDGAIALLLALAFLLWVLFKVLLVIAVVAAVVGGVWAIAKAVQFLARSVSSAAMDRHELQQFERAAAPTIAPASVEELSDPERRLSLARRAFEAWVSRLPGAPADAGECVHSADLSMERTAMLTIAIEGRRLVWRSRPYGARSLPSHPARTFQQKDAWSEDASDIADMTRHSISCNSCFGGGKQDCDLCRATGRVTCGGCSGAGKAYSYAANGSYRLMNCKICHGKGWVGCGGCVRGVRTCDTCKGQCNLEQWMEVESWARIESRIAPRTDGVQVLGWREDDHARSQAIVDARIVESIQNWHQDGVPQADVVPDALRRELVPFQQRVREGERIARSVLDVLEIPRVTVDTQIGVESEALIFTGLRMVSPSMEGDNVWTRRARKLKIARAVAAAVPIIIAAASLYQGKFYWSATTAIAIASIVASSFLSYRWFTLATLSHAQAKRWMAAAAACVAVAAISLIVGRPSVSHARAAIAAGSLDSAEEELTALGDDAITAAAWGDLRLERVKRTESYEQAADAAATINSALPQRRVADAVVDSMIVTAASSALRNGDTAAAARALARASSQLRVSPEGGNLATLTYLTLARQCTDSRNWACTAENVSLAKEFAVGKQDLDKTVAVIRREADSASESAAGVSSAQRRLEKRIDAEAAWRAWEKAAGTKSSQLETLRTQMAHDVQALESRARNSA